ECLEIAAKEQSISLTSGLRRRVARRTPATNIRFLRELSFGHPLGCAITGRNWLDARALR
ncbi:MAG: hypothetical protein M1296_01965, partial [Chloroflexi bacterium]|nr:hypothetical protein [Chloroflexota bacterium]